MPFKKHVNPFRKHARNEGHKKNIATKIGVYFLLIVLISFNNIAIGTQY